MFGMVLAMAMGAVRVEPMGTMHAQPMASARQCIAAVTAPDECLSAARKECVARLAHGRPSDPLLESFCAKIENGAWESKRLEVESKLEAVLTRWKENDVLVSVRAARKAWEVYRDNWCEDESRTVPTALTGQTDLARQTCNIALTRERLARVERMIDRLNP